MLGAVRRSDAALESQLGFPRRIPDLFLVCLPWGCSSCRALYAETIYALFAYAQRREKSCFQPRPRLLAPPSPGPFDPGSFSRAFAPLRSSFVAPLGRSPCGDLSCLGLFPHRGVPEGVHSLRERARPRYVPSSGFCNLSTAFSTFPLCGLVSSRCHVQGSSRSGVLSPSRRGRDSSPRPCPRAVGPRLLTDQYPIISDRAVFGCHKRFPRLRGFAPRSDAYPGLIV